VHSLFVVERRGFLGVHCFRRMERRSGRGFLGVHCFRRVHRTFVVERDRLLLHRRRLRRHGGRHLRLVTGCLERLRWDDVIAFGCQEFLPGTNFLARQLTSGVTEFLT
jgi:hypothetical protein